MQDTPAPNQEHQQHAHQHHAAPPAPERMAPPPPPVPEAMQPQTVVAHEAAGGDYPSAPLPTVKSGLLALWQNGGHAIWALVVVQVVVMILLAIAAVVAILAGLVAIFSALANGQSQVADAVLGQLATQVPGGASQALSGLAGAGSAAGAIAIISLVAAFVLGVFLQSSVIAFAGLTVAERQRVSFGQVMKLGFKRIGALFVQSLILFGAALVVLLLPLLMLSGGGNTGSYILIFVYYAAVLIAGIYVGLRLSFAPLAAVALSMGPIQSMKYSWEISKKRLWEILGAVSIITVISTVVSLIFTYLQSSLTNAAGASLIVSLVEIAAYLLINVLSFAVIAERLNQFRAVGANQSTHKFMTGANVLPFVIAIVVSGVGSSIERSMTPTYNSPYNTYPGSSLYPSTTPDNSSLQDELDQYYRDSQNMQQDGTNLYDYSDPSSPYYDPSYDSGSGTDPSLR